jgi:hypothetical protein
MAERSQVNAKLPAHIINKLVEHGTYLEVSKSEYLALIARKWFADGCPPVTDEEEALRLIIEKTGDHTYRGKDVIEYKSHKKDTGRKQS